MKKKRRSSKKGINWSSALKKALAQEEDVDAMRAVALIRELYYLVIIKHGNKN